MLPEHIQIFCLCREKLFLLPIASAQGEPWVRGIHFQNTGMVHYVEPWLVDGVYKSKRAMLLFIKCLCNWNIGYTMLQCMQPYICLRMENPRYNGARDIPHFIFLCTHAMSSPLREVMVQRRSFFFFMLLACEIINNAWVVFVLSKRQSKLSNLFIGLLLMNQMCIGRL